MAAIVLQDGVVEGDSVRVEVQVNGGYVTITVPKAELDAAATKAAKVAIVVAQVKQLLSKPAGTPPVTVALAGTTTVDLVAPPATA